MNVIWKEGNLVNFDAEGKVEEVSRINPFKIVPYVTISAKRHNHLLGKKYSETERNLERGEREISKKRERNYSKEKERVEERVKRDRSYSILINNLTRNLTSSLSSATTLLFFICSTDSKEHIILY